MKPRCLSFLFLIMFLGLVFVPWAQAAGVGQFTQVEGAVDLLKGGQAPTIPVKVQDGVEVGDVVRTKSQSRAQIKFIDDTTLTISPESRVAVETYMFDAPKGQRQAVLQVFRGLVHTLVTKVIKTEDPNFLIKTHTATVGVRGTSTYSHLHHSGTDIYNEAGIVRASNILPEVPGRVELGAMEYSRVAPHLPPTVGMPFSMEDLAGIKARLAPRGGAGPSGTGGTGGGTVGSTGADQPLGPASGTGTGTGTTTTFNAVSLTNPANSSQNPVSSVYSPPSATNTPAAAAASSASSSGPTISTFAFLMYLYGYHTLTPTSSYSATVSGGSWGQLTGVYPEYFTTSGSGTRSSTDPIFTSTLTNTYSNTFSGTVSGISGQSLTGTYSSTGTSSTGYSGIFSGSITINPDGTFSYSYNNLNYTNGTYTETGTGSASGTPGTYFRQTAVGSLKMTSNSVGHTQTITNNSDPTNGTYLIWGTRTGVYPGQFSATMSMTNTAPVTGYYPPLDQGGLSATMQGVVSGTDGGTQTGVMTTTGSGGSRTSSPYTFAGPVTINPDGSLAATFYGTNTDNSVSPPPAGTFKQTGTWNQTAQAIPAASTYSLSIPNLYTSYFLNPTSSTTASLDLQALGMRPSGGSGTSSSVYPGYYLGGSNGTATGSFTTGNNVSGSVSGTLSATVTGILGGYNLTGTATFIPDGQTTGLTGPVTITPNGTMTFNYSGPLTISGQTVTASGTLTQDVAIGVSQSASGTYQVVSGGSNPTLLNTGQMSGSRIIGGSSLSSNASLALSYGNGFALPALSAGGTGTFSLSGSGAVSPWYGGQQTWGLMNSTVTVNGTTSSGNATFLTYDPTTGNLTGQIATGNGSSGAYLNAVLAATPTSSGQTTTSFYQTLSGTYQQTSSSPYSTGVYTNTSPLTGTMRLGGSGSIVSAPITANFNLTGTGASGAFPSASVGTVTTNSFLGAVAGRATGTQTGIAMGSATFTSVYGSSFMGFGGAFTLGPNTTTPPLQATLTIGQGNTGYSPNGYPITVTGTWTQSDPPLTGTSTGLMAGNINKILAITSTASQPIYGTSGSGPIITQMVGAVGGPAGGPQTGVASMHSIRTINSQTRTSHYLGTATFKPASGSTPATLTTNLNGLNLPSSGVSARQTGTVTVTPK